MEGYLYYTFDNDLSFYTHRWIYTTERTCYFSVIRVKNKKKVKEIWNFCHVNGHAIIDVTAMVAVAAATATYIMYFIVCFSSIYDCTFFESTKLAQPSFHQYLVSNDHCNLFGARVLSAIRTMDDYFITLQYCY